MSNINSKKLYGSLFMNILRPSILNECILSTSINRHYKYGGTIFFYEWHYFLAKYIYYQ
jgi:hypothetical protein